ncbi:MGMT family protein [Propioniciclava flava]
MSIIVPCHRLVGASGAMTGYAGGVEHEVWLLTHEGALAS